MSYRNFDFDWLEEIIVPAIDIMYRTPGEMYLLKHDANEKTIVANLYCKMNSILLKKRENLECLDGLSIDVEYNRNQMDPKKAYEKCFCCHSRECFVKENTLDECNMIPDLIIHQRGPNQNNQVAIEFKKASNANVAGRNSDNAKLIYFTCQKPFLNNEDKNLKYRIGFFMDLCLDMYTVTIYEDAQRIVIRERRDGSWVQYVNGQRYC